MEGKTVYFEEPGTGNTDETLRIARARADEMGINTIIVATTGGDTALKAVDVFKGMKVIAVTHSTGMREPNYQEVPDDVRQQIEDKGGIVLTTNHAFMGISAAVRKKFSTYLVGDIVASSLRIFGAGTKVACEVSMMAADAGLVRTDEDAIAIGGTHRGADTALVLKPVNTTDFFDMQVREFLCKPHF